MRLYRHVATLDIEHREAWRNSSASPSFHWRDGDTGVTFRAEGDCLEGAPFHREFGPDPLRSIRFELVHEDGLAEEATGRLPAALHALGFDASRPREARSFWEGWPTCATWLPRHLVVTTAHGTSFTITHALASDGAPSIARAELRERSRAFSERVRRHAPRSSAGTMKHATLGPSNSGSSTEQRRFVEVVEAARAAIAAGELEKLVVARSEVVSSDRPFDPWRQLDALSTLAARAITFGWHLGRLGTWLGATPEVLVRICDGKLETSAIAGTARRDEDPNGARLLADAKCQLEHDLVVRTMTEELRNFAAELVVADAPHVLVSERLVHLETRMHGTLTRGSLVEVARALHPTPALGGRPRAASLAWLREHEGLDRGHYGAPIGWEAPNGDGVLAVAIRSALLRDRRAHLFAGAGIVAASDPDAEWRETASKLELARTTLITSDAAPNPVDGMDSQSEGRAP